MTNYTNYNSRNIFEYFTPKKALFLCIDALDFKDAKGDSAPRLKVRCCSHDDTLSEGTRMTDEVTAYIPIGTFLVFAHNILSGVYMRGKRASSDKYTTYFEHYGGSRTPTVTSTKLALVNGMSETANFALLATSGPGEVTPLGGIIPQRQKPDVPPSEVKSIFINMPDDKLKEFCLIGQAYIEQYIAIDLQLRLGTVRKQRESYKENREREYINAFGYGASPNPAKVE